MFIAREREERGGETKGKKEPVGEVRREGERVGMLDLIGGEQWMADSLVARGGCGVWDGIFLLMVRGARWS